MVLSGAISISYGQQLICYLFRKRTINDLLAKDLISLFLDSLRIILRVHPEIVVEEIEQDTIILLLAGVVGQKSQQAIALLAKLQQELLVDLVEQLYQVLVDLSVFVPHYEDV